jgi:hypothetical protein
MGVFSRPNLVVSGENRMTGSVVFKIGSPLYFMSTERFIMVGKISLGIIQDLFVPALFLPYESDHG